MLDRRIDFRHVEVITRATWLGFVHASVKKTT